MNFDLLLLKTPWRLQDCGSVAATLGVWHGVFLLVVILEKELMEHSVEISSKVFRAGLKVRKSLTAYKISIFDMDFTESLK